MPESQSQPQSQSQSPSKAHAHYPFDHAVISVRDQIDAAAARFSALGFRVTPRGFHTLGSVNHLIVFGTTYVELLGFPADNPSIRADLRDAPLGLNGLVFRSDDATKTREETLARHAPMSEAQQFSRPVDLADDWQHASTDMSNWPDAIFRTVRAAATFNPSGRLYFCQHLTPQLVWRDPWRAHPNGVVEIESIRVFATNLAETAAKYRQLLGAAAVTGNDTGKKVTVSAPPLRIELRAADIDRMQGLRLRVSDLEKTIRALELGAVPYTTQYRKAVRDTATGKKGQPPIESVNVAPEYAGNVALEFCL